MIISPLFIVLLDVKMFSCVDISDFLFIFISTGKGKKSKDQNHSELHMVYKLFCDMTIC